MSSTKKNQLAPKNYQQILLVQRVIIKKQKEKRKMRDEKTREVRDKKVIMTDSEPNPPLLCLPTHRPRQPLCRC